MFNLLNSQFNCDTPKPWGLYISIVPSAIMYNIKTNCPFVLPYVVLAAGDAASKATPEEISEKQTQLEQAYADKAKLEKERASLNDEHSRAGDNNSSNEAQLGDELEVLDGLLTETKTLTGFLVLWLGS